MCLLMFTVAMSCVVIALEAHCVVEKEQKEEEENYHKCFQKVKNLTVWDKELIQVALNLEYLEAEFFLWSSVGKGLDKFAPYLAKGGPHPIGVQKANLPPLLADVFFQFGLQEVGHLRAIHKGLKEYAFPRPLLDVSTKTWAKLFDKVIGKELKPPFDPYCNGLNYVISAYTIPYVGLTGYVGANPLLLSKEAKKLVAGLLGVESGQDAVIRTFLYHKRHEEVKPYGITVAEFTDKISSLRNELSHAFLDEGLVVPRPLGPEGLTKGNILSADKDSLAYGRTPEQVFATVYGTGTASKPGGFYPKGGHGKIAQAYLYGCKESTKEYEKKHHYKKEHKEHEKEEYEKEQKEHEKKSEKEHHYKEEHKEHEEEYENEHHYKKEHKEHVREYKQYEKKDGNGEEEKEESDKKKIEGKGESEMKIDDRKEEDKKEGKEYGKKKIDGKEYEKNSVGKEEKEKAKEYKKVDEKKEYGENESEKKN
ncbi:unnamed protein product [Sphagnum jensenii]|uniref:Desiccation-related protein PCC13-62 n=1 Tax=Sphagnum jensenii TaxID=128206 RepID=A0ABP1BDE1_9BRYO